ncbi:MAG: hypothetical protein JWN41_816 [Thermoleophilia bacterium]|nr:hypothetical protein [Thermoleophilia bacterium]
MNDTAPRHPDDPTLFDFAADTLDVETRATVRRHIDHCAACSAFLAAAVAGSQALSDVVEPMPEPAVRRLRLTLDHAWSERNDGEPHPAPTVTPRPARFARGGAQAARRSTGWRRRAVPVLALAVVGSLAAVSFSMVNDTAVRGDRAPHSTRDRALPRHDGGDSGAAADESAAVTAKTVSGAVAQPSAGKAEPSAPSEPVCGATYDASTLELPGGRYPATVISGPLGVVVVCG